MGVDADRGTGGGSVDDTWTTEGRPSFDSLRTDGLRVGSTGRSINWIRLGCWYFGRLDKSRETARLGRTNAVTGAAETEVPGDALVASAPEGPALTLPVVIDKDGPSGLSAESAGTSAAVAVCVVGEAARGMEEPEGEAAG